MHRSRGTGRTWTVAGALALASLAGGGAAQERRFELGLEVPVVKLSQVDETDTGLGLRLGFDLSRSVALEAAAGYFPANLGEPAFSGSRWQALLGLKAGRRGEKAGIFATARGGVTSFSEAPAPFPCILIYPPPLNCQMGAGDTLATVELGGAFEYYPSSRSVLRVEVGDQMLRWPGPVIDGEGEVRDGDFWDHDLRLSVGFGWRF